MLTIDNTFDSQKQKSTYVLGDIKSVALIVWFLLWGCSVTIEETKILSEPDITNPALQLSKQWIENSKRLPTDLPEYNSLNLPKLRWPIQMLPTHNYREPTNQIIENIKDTIDSIQVHPIGPVEITIGKNNIIEIRKDSK